MTIIPLPRFGENQFYQWIDDGRQHVDSSPAVQWHKAELKQFL